MKYRPRRETPLGANEMAVFKDVLPPLSENFARLLYTRGIDTSEKVKQFFDISPERMHDPFLLNGMREAVERIERAISAKERILIIGDYDADGISATAILYKYFITRHVSTKYFLPDRSADGYGLTVDLIDKLNEMFHPNLLITVDCGISCPTEIEHAKALGIDCIVTDHHAIPEHTPDCTCINAKFDGQAYPFKDLCGAGVALKLVHAMGGREVALKYIDICAIATVADIVALKDENRVIVKLGLEKLNHNSLPSITALAKSCNIHGELKSSDISFKLGPKINASGRMGNAKKGLDVILEQNEAEIEKIIRHLAEYNTRRQKLCNSIYAEVEAVVEKEKLFKNNLIILADEKWESGVLGIVSARITEKYGKPSIILGIHEGIVKGSGRSIDGINLVKTVEMFSEYIESFGGHSMATGLSLKIDNYPKFRDKIVAHMNKAFASVSLEAERVYDFDIEFDQVKQSFVAELEKLEPTGCENPAPLFMATVTQCQVGALSNYPAHIRFSYKNMQFIFFNGHDCGDILACNTPKRVLFEFQKPDGTDIVKAVCKSIVPIATDPKSYAMTLTGHLTEAFYYEPDMKMNNILQGLSCDRETFVNYYKFLRGGNGTRAYNMYDLFVRMDIGANEGKYNLFQFVFCATVFKQLGLMAFVNGTLQMTENKNSTDLFESSAYNKVRENENILIKEKNIKWQKA